MGEFAAPCKAFDADIDADVFYVLVNVYSKKIAEAPVTMASDNNSQRRQKSYPLDDFVGQITRSAEEGKLVAANKNKAEQMLTTIGIQPSEVSCIISLTNTII